MSTVTALIIRDEADWLGILVINGRKSDLVSLGIILDDTSIAYRLQSYKSFLYGINVRIREILFGKIKNQRVYCPIRPVLAMCSEIIINAIDIMHIRDIDKTAVFLEQTSVIKPVSERSATLVFECIYEIIRSQSFKDRIDNLFLQPPCLFYLTLGVSEERIEALLCQKLFTIVDDHPHKRMNRSNDL